MKLRVRNREEITVVAVTKEVSASKLLEVMDAGIIHLGENRPEVLLGKQEVITIRTSLAFYRECPKQKSERYCR